MRYYLDTNMLVFLMTGDTDNISHDIMEIIEDCGNILLTSMVCVQEFVHLVQIGKVGGKKKQQITADDVLPWIHNAAIEIKPVAEAHVKAMVNLPLYADHRDPADRLIVAQAIADRVPVISSDHKFRLYERHGLEFVYNKR